MLAALAAVSSAASADQILLDAGREPFHAGSNTNRLFVHLANESRRQGLEFSLTYDPALADPIDVQGAGRVQDPVQLYHRVSPPGVLHVLICDDSGTRAPLDVGADPIVCITFAIPATVLDDTLRVSIVDGLAASDVLAPVPIPSRTLGVPILGPAAVPGESATASSQGVPERFALYQNAPNPFATSTQIRFDVPRRSHVRLVVYDLAGKLVRTLQDGSLPPGRHSTVWDGRSTQGVPVANGIYFYVAQMGRQRIARKTIRLP